MKWFLVFGAISGGTLAHLFRKISKNVAKVEVVCCQFVSSKSHLENSFERLIRKRHLKFLDESFFFFERRYGAYSQGMYPLQINNNKRWQSQKSLYTRFPLLPTQVSFGSDTLANHLVSTKFPSRVTNRSRLLFWGKNKTQDTRPPVPDGWFCWLSCCKHGLFFLFLACFLNRMQSVYLVRKASWV